MGTVYSAYDPKLDRRVALKVMSSASSVARARHLEEARALARLSHPNVVIVHDAGECRGSVFVAMEFVEGCTLEAHLRDADPGPDRTIALFVEGARGLSAAHRAGVIHRDFTQTIALVGDDGRVRVADFGLARTRPHRRSCPRSARIRPRGRPLQLLQNDQSALEDRRRQNMHKYLWILAALGALYGAFTAIVGFNEAVSAPQQAAAAAMGAAYAVIPYVLARAVGELARADAEAKKDAMG